MVMLRTQNLNLHYVNNIGGLQYKPGGFFRGLLALSTLLFVIAYVFLMVRQIKHDVDDDDDDDDHDEDDDDMGK